MRKLVLTRIGYKQAEAGELPISERRSMSEKAMSSAFSGKKLRDYGDTSEEFGAKALGIKKTTATDDEIDKLQAVLKNEDLKPNVRRAVEGTIDILKTRTASATTKSSEPLANAFINMKEDPYEDRVPVDVLNQEKNAIEERITIGRVIKDAARKAEPDSKEFKELMGILEKINKELVELGEDPFDLYGE